MRKYQIHLSDEEVALIDQISCLTLSKKEFIGSKAVYFVRGTKVMLMIKKEMVYNFKNNLFDENLIGVWWYYFKSKGSKDRNPIKFSELLTSNKIGNNAKSELLYLIDIFGKASNQ